MFTTREKIPATTLERSVKTKKNRLKRIRIRLSFSAKKNVSKTETAEKKKSAIDVQATAFRISEMFESRKFW